MVFKRIILLVLVFNCVNVASSLEEVIESIQSIINKLPAGSRTGLMVYNPLTQDTILNINHTESMIPASNTKLFTTAAALDLMGGDFLLSTKLLSDDSDLEDRVINGNLYLKGLGNSIFTIEDIIEMVDSLIAIGITKITGNIVGDDTYFDDVYTRDDWIKDEKANVKLPAISALVLDRNRTKSTKKRRGRYRTYIINVENPPLHAAKKLKEILEHNNIEVSGNADYDETPLTANLITECSVKLREVLKLINKRSDNFLAECLFKTIGAVASGRQGNSFYSTQAVLTFIKDNAIYSKGTSIVDGSGISRYDQVTPGAIIGLLEKMYFDINNFDDFYNSLAIAGVDGTLDERMSSTLAESNFRGKTGTLNGVSSISGYLTTAGGEDLIICIIFEFNNGRWKTFRNLQDEIIEALAEWKEKSPDEFLHQGYLEN
ncbi:MAG: D-alanyl-D-alanine carboxypeptidase/D-alanyl-D-alanine-endopeptidase [Ignavibacteria bacterium]|nr:D-alanyl-D-alanine carboxypeptidase/D-alanyl-D-alanine-endopeptidase [Ignavibacteria bacterium]MBT8381440.1 D-alanyl-D-alanine carboxypeptidase/D-alanyl-D-alanine-endopeptidase [Ignavibacteria bacterium]MBT8392704.1 D-alanyl-D-alanine carboxypeptidase/D-alanyl-D-alanine-endopeptidase [Ignavibacteria bacterium]NNJ52516.1 D-alanyl-D-alanine carboxypeptidase/D-alanyl-D-alanine-endopeptidase [Ignavibacteriaceae bacterium]NNL21961.1 D-alanyl-D-alanine carboxypeptidase/D-alanyl-D-alanine-endopepti